MLLNSTIKPPLCHKPKQIATPNDSLDLFMNDEYESLHCNQASFLRSAFASCGLLVNQNYEIVRSVRTVQSMFHHCLTKYLWNVKVLQCKVTLTCDDDSWKTAPQLTLQLRKQVTNMPLPSSSKILETLLETWGCLYLRKVLLFS